MPRETPSAQRRRHIRELERVDPRDPRIGATVSYLTPSSTIELLEVAGPPDMEAYTVPMRVLADGSTRDVCFNYLGGHWFAYEDGGA